jgi:hypothetical protein
MQISRKIKLSNTVIITDTQITQQLVYMRQKMINQGKYKLPQIAKYYQKHCK